MLEQLIELVNANGKLGIPGLHVPSDPGARDPHARKGMLPISFGRLFEKGLSLHTGQCNVKRYNRYLRDLIVAGRARPSLIVSNELPLDAAPDAYEKFDKRVEGLHEGAAAPSGGVRASIDCYERRTMFRTS